MQINDIPITDYYLFLSPYMEYGRATDSTLVTLAYLDTLRLSLEPYGILTNNMWGHN